MCIFNKGRECLALVEKVCNNKKCSFFCTEKAFIDNQKRADALFTRNTGCQIEDRLSYVESHYVPSIKYV